MIRRFMIAVQGIGCAALCLHGQASPQTTAQTFAPVAAHDLARGVELAAADIAGDSGSASRVGWITRRVIRAGEPLKVPAIAPAQLVRAGVEVTVRAAVGGVLVTRTGTALSSGSLGDRIRVRLDSQHTITGIVASSASVKIQ
jgi:flagella basal body P-ring formation protein FlgA